MAVEKETPYLAVVLKSIPRLLSLQDRRLLSPSYGCFDKNFWHFKTSDFANAAAQMGSEALARLWAWPAQGNPYFANPRLRDWAKQGLLYLTTLQKRDGSFDEWYPNERGWAGPTGYVLHSLVSGYQILSEEWEELERERILTAIRQAAEHLKRRDEGHVLANHFAVTLMALYDAWEVLGEDWIWQAYHYWWSQFENHVCSEGWSLEYDGVDLGYNLATLGFLGRIHARHQFTEIENYCQKSFQFLSYFCWPDKNFGGRIGVRGTSHIYPFALNYWANFFPEARSMANWLLSSSEDLPLGPEIQDDRYLVYRLSDYIEAGQIEKNWEEVGPLPFARQGCWTHHFSEAGLYIRKSPKYYFVSNLRRGGAFLLYHLGKSELVLADAGVVGRVDSKSLKVLSSQTSNVKWKIEIEEKSCSTEGPLVKVRSQCFNPFSFLLFRSFILFFGSFGFLSYWAKILIRKLLIVGERAMRKTHFKRQFSFEENRVYVEDKVMAPKGNFYTGFDFSVRYVPQSQYFQEHELFIEPKCLKEMPEGYQLKREWDF